MCSVLSLCVCECVYVLECIRKGVESIIMGMMDKNIAKLTYQ